jgi:hypothetical protein
MRSGFAGEVSAIRTPDRDAPPPRMGPTNDARSGSLVRGSARIGSKDGGSSPAYDDDDDDDDDVGPPPRRPRSARFSTRRRSSRSNVAFVSASGTETSSPRVVAAADRRAVDGDVREDDDGATKDATGWKAWRADVTTATAAKKFFISGYRINVW